MKCGIELRIGHRYGRKTESFELLNANGHRSDPQLYSFAICREGRGYSLVAFTHCQPIEVHWNDPQQFHPQIRIDVFVNWEQTAVDADGIFSALPVLEGIGQKGNVEALVEVGRGVGHRHGKHALRHLLEEGCPVAQIATRVVFDLQVGVLGQCLHECLGGGVHDMVFRHRRGQNDALLCVGGDAQSYADGGGQNIAAK